MTRQPAARARPGRVPRQTPGEAVPPATKQRPPILVELNAAIDGWPAQSRFDVLVHGQITSTAPVDSFSVRNPAGLELAAVQFGHGDEQETVTLEDDAIAFRSGFQIYLPMPGGDGIRIADLWFRAQARDGAVFEQSMRLGCMADQAAILAGPAHDMPGVELPAPRGIVYLESAEITADGRLLVHGWTLATSQVVTVQIFADGTRIGAAVLGHERADVADAYPAYPNARRAGFVLERPADGATRGAVAVTAQVLCLSGACLATTIPLIRSSEPPPRSSTPPRQDMPAPVPPHATADANTAPPIRVFCDHATVTASGVLLVEGWAAGGNGIERVAIEVDGRPVGDADHGRARVDVAAADATVPVGSGFHFERAIPDLSGISHDIRIIAISRGGHSGDVTVTVLPPPKAAFRFELDGPKTHDGAAVQPITGRLVVEGWALARDGVAGVDVALDGTLLGQAHYGMARPDVGVAFPDWDNAARSGYTFHCPSRALPEGEHAVQVIARSKTGERHVHEFRITVRKTDDPEAEASIRRRIRQVERNTMTGVLDQLDWRPAFHLIVTGDPAGDPAGDFVAGAANEAAWDLTFRSIVEQSWPDWRVTVLASGPREAETARRSIARLADEQAGRFAVTDPSDAAAWDAALAAGHAASQSGASGSGSLAGEAPECAASANAASNSGGSASGGSANAASASGGAASGGAESGASENGASLIGLLSCGDELGRDALGAFAIASGVHRRADCLYADDFRLAPGSTRPEAFFKPDFSPALLLSANYIGRPLVVRPALLAATGATARSLMHDGFHDLALRCTEAAGQTYHVTELLSRTDGGAASNRSDGAAVEHALARRGIAAEVLPGAAPQTWRVRRTTPVTGKVSIIVPTCAAKGYIETCLTTLRAATEYRNYQIVCIDNIPETDTASKAFVRDHADKVVAMPEPFNWSRFNNTAAAASDGEYLLFLNDDVEIVQPDWLEAMLEAAAWPGVGIVGARLLYPNRTVQHAGMFLGDGMGRHAFRHATETDPCYFGLALTRREVIGVTGACLLVRRAIFEQLGGFDEAHGVVNNDLDFCLRAHRAGLSAIYTPHATLIHHELASRAHLRDDFDTTRFIGQWRSLFAAGDPYFNPHLSRYTDDYRIDDEGVRVMHAGHPLIDRASVKAILVVKVDHIGDFIISLPAIRRLKAAFPGARLTALIAPASAAIAAIEPAIDECIPFQFFFERSELGEKELSETDLAALAARLAPYRFDIAVDLRKHLSTRRLLLCSGARLLAGYDSLDHFPWLDVVLEWDGDKALQRRRNHIVDDLVNLAAAIDAACEPNRRLFEPKPAPMAVEDMPEHVRHLFARPVVVIHPGSGNVMRQWPEKHYPPLIDLLLEQNDVAVLLIGGRDDEEKVASILGLAARSDRIGSVAGQIPLGDLPRLLAACALFIGGNSGPKHIAAASGVPTIGIHSGVVDPGEWGPIGERTVALYRDMSCAPCFLAKPEHCPRGLACVEMLDPPLVHKMAQMFLARPVVPRIAPSDAAPWQGPDAAARYVAALLTLGAASGPREVSERVSPPVKSGKPASTVPKEAVIPGRQSRKRVLPMGGPK